MLISSSHDHRGAGDESPNDRASGVTKPPERVEVHKCRAPGRLGVSIGHSDNGHLLQAEYMAQLATVERFLQNLRLGTVAFRRQRNAGSCESTTHGGA